MDERDFQKPDLLCLRSAGDFTPTNSDIDTRARELDIDPLLVELMFSRGIATLGEQRKFLNPRLQDLSLPTSMAGYAESIDLLITARRNNWRVGIFGDYDVDGITTTTILLSFLERIGIDVIPHVASREGGPREYLDLVALGTVCDLDAPEILRARLDELRVLARSRSVRRSWPRDELHTVRRQHPAAIGRARELARRCGL